MLHLLCACLQDMNVDYVIYRNNLYLSKQSVGALGSQKI